MVVRGPGTPVSAMKRSLPYKQGEAMKAGGTTVAPLVLQGMWGVSY